MSYIDPLDDAEELDWTDVDVQDERYCGEFEDTLKEEQTCSQFELSNEYNIKDLIEKVRVVVRMFKKSPTKNEEVLQKRVLEEHKKELVVDLDSKTRWNSTSAMIEKFLRLKKAIGLALIDLDAQTSFNNDEWGLLSHISECVKPIEIAVKKLCASNTNLIKADAIFSVLLKKLNNFNDQPFGQNV